MMFGSVSASQQRAKMGSVCVCVGGGGGGGGSGFVKVNVICPYPSIRLLGHRVSL